MVDRLYVINLERDRARRDHSIRALAAAGFPADRVEVHPAVDGKALTPQALAARGVTVYPHWRLADTEVTYFNRELKWGEIGCALSHLDVWQRIADGSDEVALILEDDVLWPGPHAAAEVDRALGRLAALRPDWHLCYVGRAVFTAFTQGPCYPKLPRPDLPVEPGLVVPTFCYGGFAYAITRGGARRLVSSGLQQAVVAVDEFLPALFVPHPREDLRALFGQGDRLNAFALEPRLARQDFSPESTIETTGNVTLAEPSTVPSPDKRPPRRSSSTKQRASGDPAPRPGPRRRASEKPRPKARPPRARGRKT